MERVLELPLAIVLVLVLVVVLDFWPIFREFSGTRTTPRTKTRATSGILKQALNGERFLAVGKCVARKLT